MAIKKSALYSSLWASCDELRGGMDASQYKDYVLVMLFIKYISDKYAGVPYAPITVPMGASFQDMVALKGTKDIGDQINKKIIEPIANENRLNDMPDFADVTKLGDGKEQVDRLTNLIAIFEDPKLDFSNNRADGDDLLGDAYEYLMRHFATESGKSKGQFYTPAEVSRIMAKIIGIGPDNTSAETTVYDPTCGSGSLLLKVAEETEKSISLYGQEKDSATSGLARMNFILHDNPSAKIMQGNTLANPKYLAKNGGLKQFDYVVANPPFSDKRWSNGVDVDNDYHERFEGFGEPPAKNGDYAYLLHIIRSLKSKGKGACILPHGVLFRGNAEEEIRKNLIKRGYIKGIIGLPANLFYGTGIPACIILIDKENAHNRKGIFMIDASKGFVKDGPKNRLRDQDLHKVVDVFNKRLEQEKYARMVPYFEIEGNDFNLNIPRYIDAQEPEDIQDIEAHLSGGIPKVDIEALSDYWKVYPSLKTTLFSENGRENYRDLVINKQGIKQSIFEHPEFVGYSEELGKVFSSWKSDQTQYLKSLEVGCKPKQVIHDISEDILLRYDQKELVDKYQVYQHLMTYWAETMQDDAYQIAADGWKAETYRILVENKQKKMVDKGWTCDLIPKALVIDRYFQAEKGAIEALQVLKESIATQLEELEEEHSGEDGYFAELEKVNKANVNKRLKELKTEPNVEEEVGVLKAYLELLGQQSANNKKLKEAEADLDAKLYAKYPRLTEDEVKILAVDDKWITAIQRAVQNEMDQISQRLAMRLTELVNRYEEPLPLHLDRVKELESKVNSHLEKMGFKWS